MADLNCTIMEILPMSVFSDGGKDVVKILISVCVFYFLIYCCHINVSAHDF